ncbi:hypothetical protein CLV92_10663 [Kineococcus xinjiangensis]|uniref:Cell division protein FtsL n=1 Tax=Kineococcus xinjiangensis TaxID=512762 RepID=A0A2S6ILY1_9ACTN|nr:septum formation initiator family protein [Kineococcus xinjiangensis]PPK95242.1 hypothetical protein CLV92_10663 [Kineococcus xinjiangensis]
MSQPLIAARNASVRAFRHRPLHDARPALRVVAPPAALAARLPLPLTCVLLLTAGLLALLMMNIAIARDAFTLSELEREATLLAEQQQAVDEGIAAKAAPQALHEQATRLGMVPAPAPTHLARDGRVVVPLPVVEEPEPVVAEESPVAEEPLAADEPAAAEDPAGAGEPVGAEAAPQ